MRYLLLLLLATQEIPDHPDKLKYSPLKFDVPDPAKLRTQLRTGPIVYAIEDPGLPLIQIEIHFRAGSFWVPRGKAGLAALCSTGMRTGGTKKMTPQALDEELDFLAAELGVSIGETSGSVSLSILAKDLDRGLELLFEVLFNPAFSQEKIDLAKAQMLDALKGRNDSTSAIESREANLLFYGDEFPLNSLATKASLEGITREDLVDFHRRHVHPGGMIVAASGNFKKDELLGKLEKAFADAPKSERPEISKVPPVRHTPAPGVYGFQKVVPQGRVTIGHLGIDLTHPDLHTIRIMNYIYGGGGFSSRLMQRVRTDEGLVYDVRSMYQPGITYLGTFRIQFQSKNESCAFAIALCFEELKKMREQKVDAKVLDEAKKYFVDGFPAFFFATKGQTVSTFAGAELNGFPKDYYHTYREKIAAVTADDVMRVAREQIHPDKFVIICVGNVGVMEQGDGKHEFKLSTFGPVKLVPLPNPETLERTK